MLGATSPALPIRASLLVPLMLFSSSALFTVWRNSQVAALVDIAYPLNTATRIAAGDVPYADFPLAHAPLHFLFQAALIKLFGPSFAIQIAYAAIFSGLAALLTYWIAARLLESVVRRPGLLAAALSLPLVPLGIYSVLPHPFYDSDACLAVLAGIAAILAAQARPTPRRWLLAGALLTVPLLIKQNIGGAFLMLALAVLVAEAIARPAARAGVRWYAAGLLIALLVEAAALQLVIGIDHIVHWTWSYAMEGRGLSLARIAVFADPRVLWPALLLIGVAVSARIGDPRGRAAMYVALAAALALAAMIPTVVLAIPELFPPFLIAASVLAIVRIAREGVRFASALPLILFGTTLGTLQSQGLPGSSFGIFPLLVLAMVSFVRELALIAPPGARVAPLMGILFAAMLTTGGAGYTLSEQRLRFIDVHAPGPVFRSTFPSLAGLSARGPYIPELDEILRWTEANVPREDALVFLPGEDPAFYALGRRPRLPSVYFFDIASPVSVEEVARSADEVGLRWVFVKDRLQLREGPPSHTALVTALTDGATLVTRVGPYRVYRR